MEHAGPTHGRRQGDAGDGGTLPHHLGAQLQHTQARTCTGTDMLVIREKRGKGGQVYISAHVSSGGGGLRVLHVVRVAATREKAWARVPSNAFLA